MTVKLASNDKVAETSSKGNQEKWHDKDTDTWYKLDQFGYEALSESLISALLEQSNIESGFPFTFVRYSMERLNVHGAERTGCASRNFLRKGEALITVNRLLTSLLGVPLREKLSQLTSIGKRIDYMVKATVEHTGLAEFPRYIALLFEVDSLFCNDDRHLNNIAVIQRGKDYDYCPIFDNGAGLLSNTQISRMDIMPKALISPLRARPFNTTFNRQMSAVRNLYGRQLVMPKLSRAEIWSALQPLLPYYAQRDRGYITDRVIDCILLRQKAL